MVRNAFIITLTVLFLGILTSDVYACRCRQWGGNSSHGAWITSEAEKAEFVFSGRIVSMRRGTGMKGLHKTFTVSVTRSWKGIKRSQRTVTLETGGTSCDFEFQRGKEYLIFTSPPPPSFVRRSRPLALSTDLCTPTSQLRDAGESIGVLDKIYPRKRT